MSIETFRTAVSELTGSIAGLPLDADLAARLNREMPAGGESFKRLAGLCRTGIAEGWLCNREAAGIRYGRIVRPGPETHGFSVDVVDMADIAGPYHVHPEGEIDMIIPEDSAATFDGHPGGWHVYGPGTSHRPTVTGGRAIILYLLPGGAITFTGAG